MRNGHALLLPISGLLGRVVSDLYNKCKRDAQNRLPGLNVGFIGTPFPRAPFPLIAGDKHLTRCPEEQAVRSWARMIGFGVDILKPAQEKYDVIFCRRLGLDIVLFASACAAWNENGSRALRIHHMMVRNILVNEFGIRIPDAYIIPHAENGACEHILFDTFPELTQKPRQEVTRFLDLQKQVLRDYFDNSTGQNDPFYVDATKPLDAMFEDVMAFVQRMVELRQQH